MRNIFLFFYLAMLVGCVEVAPNLKIPEDSKQCPKQVMYMPPVANDVILTIHGDNIVNINKGGEELLRYYVLARKRLSPE